MKFFKKPLMFAVLAAGLTFTACSDNDCDDVIDFNAEFGDELQAITDAAEVYGNDPTEENCEAYKATFEEYIEAIESLQDCADDAGQGDQFRASIESSRQSLEGLQCN